jgi:hypothetical protein
MIKIKKFENLIFDDELKNLFIFQNETLNL